LLDEPWRCRFILQVSLIFLRVGTDFERIRVGSVERLFVEKMAPTALLGLLVSLVVVNAKSSETSFADGVLGSIPEGSCLEWRSTGQYWSYRWCHRFDVFIISIKI
jgi:hypothetical protein